MRKKREYAHYFNILAHYFNILLQTAIVTVPSPIFYIPYNIYCIINLSKMHHWLQVSLGIFF